MYKTKYSASFHIDISKVEIQCANDSTIKINSRGYNELNTQNNKVRQDNECAISYKGRRRYRDSKEDHAEMNRNKVRRTHGSSTTSVIQWTSLEKKQLLKRTKCKIYT